MKAACAAQLPQTLRRRVQPASGEADCLVGYGIGVQTVVEGGYPYPYGWAAGAGMARRILRRWDGMDPMHYREGIVAVDLYDGKSRQAAVACVSGSECRGV